MMKTVKSSVEMRGAAVQARRAGDTIGFVPTMGSLHEGHLSLVRTARRHCRLVVASIFVNPIQFGPSEDLANYPRDLARDEDMCARCGVDILFCPSVDDMYGPNHSVYVMETELSRVLCGVSRPDHFRGVATVVAKLFNIVQPDVAVFGQKDYQQAKIVERMVHDLSFPVRIVVSPTMRECDGLAMSSRNAYLSPGERIEAVCLSRALQLAGSMCSEGIRDADRIREAMVKIIGSQPSAAIDYVEIVDPETLKPVVSIQARALIALAVRIGRTRLIDNAIIGPAGEQPSP